MAVHSALLMLDLMIPACDCGLQGVFAAARSLSPAVILIDEADALASARAPADESSSGHHATAAGEASARTVTALLTAMDSLQGAGDQAWPCLACRQPLCTI